MPYYGIIILYTRHNMKISFNIDIESDPRFDNILLLYNLLFGINHLHS